MSTRRQLRARRKQRFPHQADYASAVGVSQETVSGWERGAYSPDPARWEKIAELLEIAVEEVAEAYVENLVEHGPQAEAMWRVEVERRLNALETWREEVRRALHD